MPYAAPVKDVRFTLKSIVGFDRLHQTGAFDDLSDDLVDAVLEGAGKLANEVIAPLNRAGDEHGAKLEADGVKAAPGFGDAYKQWVEGGWGSVPFSPDYGGQGLPKTLMLAVQEFANGANLAFGLCPILTEGAIESLTRHGSEELKERYLAKLISGEWTGTMNLTEPQAGSDVGALRAKAEPQGDGSYKITGTKIFITWGDHDVAENVIHLVLARLPDAPIGTRGISLFLVPKFLVNEDGSLGERNDAHCVGLEGKLGIHASPTCVMAFGEKGGATGYLIGEENRGMACMFTMMNSARLNVGLQGVAVAEHAYQLARDYALERRQGKPIGKQHEQKDMVPIVEHADVRRMLMTMKSGIEAARAICYANAVAIDLAHHHPDESVAAEAKSREELLTPISKGWSTDLGVQLCDVAVQVFGGMGYVEETGIAQLLRDVRITPIYEGTNGIQAIDLVTRKLPRNGGADVRALIDEMRTTVASLNASGAEDLEAIAGPLEEGIRALEAASAWLLEQLPGNPQSALAGASPYLKLFGAVAGAHFLGLGAMEAARELGAGGDTNFLRGRIATARFFAEQMVPPAAGLAGPITAGADLLYALDAEALAS